MKRKHPSTNSDRKRTTKTEKGHTYSKAAEDKLSNAYASVVKKMQKSFPIWKSFFEKNNCPERDSCWYDLDKEQNDLCHYFAWAVPDDRCLNILKHFSPLIEIAAGNGYWAYLLRKQSVDILAYDKVVSKKNCWTSVGKGSAEILSTIAALNRTLFLCYPDEQESVASSCLDQYQGEYIIHVGELMITGTVCGAPIAPFGRTTSLDFQVLLQQRFHCVLVAELKNRFPNSRDCISVWRRTEWIKRPEIEEQKKRDRQVIEESSVEFISMADLAALRGESSGVDKSATILPGTTDNNNSEHDDSSLQESDDSNDQDSGADSEESGEDGGRDEARTLSVLREILLDYQYDESGPSLWACMPAEDQLPVDRAAPAFVHLLTLPKKQEN